MVCFTICQFEYHCIFPVYTMVPISLNAPNAPIQKQQSALNQSNPLILSCPQENSDTDSTIRFSNRAGWLVVVEDSPLLLFLPHRRENDLYELKSCNFSYVTICTVLNSGSRKLNLPITHTNSRFHLKNVIFKYAVK